MVPNQKAWVVLVALSAAFVLSLSGVGSAAPRVVLGACVDPVNTKPSVVAKIKKPDFGPFLGVPANGSAGSTSWYIYGVTVYNTKLMYLTLKLPRQMTLVSSTQRPYRPMKAGKVVWRKSFNRQRGTWKLNFRVKVSPNARLGSKLPYTWTERAENGKLFKQEVLACKFRVTRPVG